MHRFLYVKAAAGPAWGLAPHHSPLPQLEHSVLCKWAYLLTPNLWKTWHIDIIMYFPPADCCQFDSQGNVKFSKYQLNESNKTLFLNRW